VLCKPNKAAQHINSCKVCGVRFVCCVICYENSSYAALSHSDITVSNLMDIIPRNVTPLIMSIMSLTAQYLPVQHNCSHNSIYVLCTCILMLSVPFTVLVLLVCKCEELLCSSRSTDCKYPINCSLSSDVLS